MKQSKKLAVASPHFPVKNHQMILSNGEKITAKNPALSDADVEAVVRLIKVFPKPGKWFEHSEVPMGISRVAYRLSRLEAQKIIERKLETVGQIHDWRYRILWKNLPIDLT